MMNNKDSRDKKTRVLITGITGFVGSHLSEYLLNKDMKIYGTTKRRSRLDYISQIKDKITLTECDITDSYSVYGAIKEVQPDIIFHLAAQSFVPTSWRSPIETIHTNIDGTLNILEAVRMIDSVDPVIQITGTSEEYGMVYTDEVPIKEANPLRPLSPYGVSKVACDLLGYQYHNSYGMKIVRTRAFNHTGKRRGSMFVTSNFAKQIADIEKRLQNPILEVGNLNAQRDFTDVRDIVRAYYLAVEKGDMGDVYNICSGNSIRIQQVLDLLLSMTDKKIEIKQVPSRMRPSDVEILQGDSSKFREKTGWKPEIPFEKTMEDLLNYWRES